MPELPEVETIKRGLAKYLQGHKVLKVEVRFRKRFEGENIRLKSFIINGIRTIVPTMPIYAKLSRFPIFLVHF